MKQWKKKENLKVMAVAIGIVLMGAGFVYADLTDGLVAHWTFDEDSGNTAYDSVGGNNGTLMGAPVWATGRIGGALDFDGANDYMHCGDILDNELGNAFTIGVWVSLGQGALQKTHNYVLWKNDDRPSMFIRSSGRVSFPHWYQHRPGTTSSFQSVQVLEEGQWYYLTYVFNGSEFIGYVNAEYAGSISDSGYSPGGSLSIAADNTSYRRFKGMLDDIRIYNRALSAEEVEALYLEGIYELTGLEVVGPEQAAEGSQVQYRAIAHYDNDSTQDVTNSADWLVEPNDIASVADGLLATERIDLPEEVTITAVYSEDGNTQRDHKDVSIFAICPSGSALKFDGMDDYVDLGNGENLKLPLPITISAWIKLDSLGINHQIISLDDQSYKYCGAWFQISRFTDQLHIAYGDGNGWGDASYRRSKSGTTVLSPDIWYHVAGVIRGATDMDLYINGQNDGGTYSGNGGDLKYLTGRSRIGIGNDTVSAFMNGVIDEVCVYNRALSEQEIQGLMHIRPDTDDPTLVGYWDFDDAEGQVVADMSGYGNNGQLGSASDADDSDPIWVASDAPIRICSLEGIVERNLSDVMDRKLSILEQLYETMEQEVALWDYMDTVFKDRDFGDASKGDVAKAKQKITGAIQQEEQAGTAIDQSIDKLDDAKNTLGIE